MIEKKETFTTFVNLVQDSLETPASTIEAIGLMIILAFLFILLLGFLTFVLVKLKGEEYARVPGEKKRIF